MKATLLARSVCVACNSLLLGVLTSPAQTEPRSSGFDAFKLVQSRNVFDPNRKAPRAEESKRTESRRPDSFTLTGTMVTETKVLAFFNGTRSEYSRVIPMGASVGPFKLKTIAAGQVELERDGKAITLPIGRTLQLEGSSGSGSPEIVDTPPAPAPHVESPGPSNAPPAAAISTSGSAPGAPASSSGGSGGASGDKNEVLRRMMERRQKEMSK